MNRLVCCCTFLVWSKEGEGPRHGCFPRDCAEISWKSLYYKQYTRFGREQFYQMYIKPNPLSGNSAYTTVFHCLLGVQI